MAMIAIWLAVAWWAIDGGEISAWIMMANTGETLRDCEVICNERFKINYSMAFGESAAKISFIWVSKQKPSN